MGGICAFFFVSPNKQDTTFSKQKCQILVYDGYIAMFFLFLVVLNSYQSITGTDCLGFRYKDDYITVRGIKLSIDKILILHMTSHTSHLRANYRMYVVNIFEESAIMK